MDFKVTAANRKDVWEHTKELTEIVLEGGGRFYFAKDMVIGSKDAQRMFPKENLARFFELKNRLDPDHLLQTDMWRRVLRPLAPKG